MLTLSDEHGGLGALGGLTVTYVGDANNVTVSLAQAMLALGVNIRVAAPQGYQLTPEMVSAIEGFAVDGARLQQFEDPAAAATGVDALYSDVWVSMGQEAEADDRRRDLAAYTIDQSLLDLASPDAIVMHCLPAHRGEEISHDVLEGPSSRVWRQAAHRRTAMRGVLRWVMGEG